MQKTFAMPAKFVAEANQHDGRQTTMNEADIIDLQERQDDPDLDTANGGTGLDAAQLAALGALQAAGVDDPQAPRAAPL